MYASVRRIKYMFVFQFILSVPPYASVMSFFRLKLQALTLICLLLLQLKKRITFKLVSQSERQLVSSTHHDIIVNYLSFTCNSQSTFVSVFTIKMPKGVSATRASGVLMVNILNKCILSILVYNLFLDRQCTILYIPQYFHTPVYWLSS